VHQILFNKRRLRAGWRLLLFIIIAVFTGLAFFFPISLPVQWLITQLLTPDSSRTAILYEGILAPALLAASWFMVTAIDRRPWRSLGLPWSWKCLPQLFWGIALGFVLVGVAVLFALLVQGASWESFPVNGQTLRLLAFSLIAWFGVSLLEELVFRGYLLQTLIEGLGVVPATLLSSLFFGLAHYDNAPQHGLYVLDAAASGFLMALMVFKTKALWMAIGFHFANDFFIDLFSWFPQPIPWNDFQIDAPSVLIDIGVALILAVFVVFSRWISPTEEMGRAFAQNIYPAPWTWLRMRLGLKAPPCYRHFDRPAGLACAICGRAICDECHSLVGQNERSSCPDCAALWALAHPDLGIQREERPPT
jgi:membrane protease YdiL (CAAX protease family)